jgi:subtilisin family serine protease
VPLLRRVQVAALGAALLAAGCVAAPSATADEQVPAGCVQPGPTLRYLVVFDKGTGEQAADQQISAACGTTTMYYPQIAVAVATSPDPDFGVKFGLDRAYSAQGEALTAGGGSTRRKVDETTSAATKLKGTESVPSADRSGEQWDMKLINAGQAHQITEGDPRVIVGVLDSGIDPHHPDLQPALDPQLSVGCLSGKPDTSVAAWSPTTSPHGTHVAGIIAAADDGKGITGVAPGVRIASVKVVDDDGYIYPEYTVCGFMWAATHGMTLTNNSYYVDPWEYSCGNQQGQHVVSEAMQRAVDYATAQGVLNIAAVTNSAADLTQPGTDSHSPDNAASRSVRSLGPDCQVLPARLRGVVAVSSVGADQLKASYSSYGLGAVDVTAPGGDARQKPQGGTDPCVLSTVPGGYGDYCGTSMAAPHVTGVAALLASTHLGDTPAQLTKLLNQQATPVQCPSDYDLNDTGVQDAYCSGYTSYNGFYGHGMVNALAAVSSGTVSTPSQQQTPTTGAVGTGPTTASQQTTGPRQQQPIGPEQLAAGQ